jgi:hypothetical protein
MSVVGLNLAQFQYLQAVAKGVVHGENRAARTCELRGWVRAGRLTGDGWHVLQQARESPPLKTGSSAALKPKASPGLGGKSD